MHKLSSVFVSTLLGTLLFSTNVRAAGAEIFTFCSAVVSRDVMEHDAGDIAYCPYVKFVYELDESRKTTRDGVTIGFRHLPEGGARDQVNTLLTEIIESAADGF